MTNQIAQAVVRRDRHIALTGLAAVIFAATLYTINMAGQFNKPMDVALMPTTHSVEHSGHSFLMLFSMWTVMQVAMMRPTAVPMILKYVKVERHRQPQQLPFFRSTLFFLGYVILWGVFSAVFTITQIELHSAELLSPTMASTSPWLSGGILIAAGLFQGVSINALWKSELGFVQSRWFSCKQLNLMLTGQGGKS